ncbi:hypothetical protein HJG54_17940 [Leptolyngbya sp. NK1-12]|uniref:Uncharacterized protein n=1 Tax=Leptolyngbya sp. NK1-12 TaxID=2547451 RepID=A0AA96WFP8_9CYAN|nr:hypothetical protein [Leptolyngbya sp. NK1-12]WNZ24548.1 hypothetical protein HJG54_17940 [Leptolyngbya sp. NK1-12]
MHSPQTVYNKLKSLEQMDIASGALYRQLAQEILADPKVSLSWRQAIAERLSQANWFLAKRNVESGDSY